MNRYESAYRDYTIQRGDESSLYQPQRPERSNNKGSRLGGGGGGIRSASALVESSDSSVESTSYDQSRMIPPQQQQQQQQQQIQINQGFISTDDESFILQRQQQQQGHHGGHHPHPHHHQISSRELSDRSGGERSNPDYLVANDAIQSYPAARSPSLYSTSMSDSQQPVQRHHHHLLADGPSYYMMNDGGTGNAMINARTDNGLMMNDTGSSSYVDQHHDDDADDRDDVVPEVYIPQPELLTRMPTSELSHGSYRTYRTVAPYSEDATLRSKKSKRGGIVIETSRAPHPMCPNTRSCCCLMLLFNLGLLLICLGFVIVLQLNDPPFVWYLGVFMLVFGFVSLIIGLIFCAWMCREGSPDAPIPPNSELYWTHHWRKTIYMPESHGRVHETPVKVPMGEEIHYMDESDSYRSQQRYHHNNNNNGGGSSNLSTNNNNLQNNRY